MKTEEDKVKILDHNYDGIQEFDHPLPSWWVGLFYITLVFSLCYFFYYEFAGGLTLSEELFHEKQEIDALKPVPDEDALKFNPKLFLAFFEDTNKIAKGEMIFKSKCTVCHGNKGQGGIGPNLTDHYWIHGKGNPEKIRLVVKNGVTIKGMPAWENSLKEEDIYAVVAHIMRIKGTNIKDGKQPQGIKVK